MIWKKITFILIRQTRIFLFMFMFYSSKGDDGIYEEIRVTMSSKPSACRTINELGRGYHVQAALTTWLVESHRNWCLLSYAHATLYVLADLSLRNTNHILFLLFLKKLTKVLHYLISSCFSHQAFCSLCLIVYFSLSSFSYVLP